jgi:hypothetical protein
LEKIGREKEIDELLRLETVSISFVFVGWLFIDGNDELKDCEGVAGRLLSLLRMKFVDCEAKMKMNFEAGYC